MENRFRRKAASSPPRDRKAGKAGISAESIASRFLFRSLPLVRALFLAMVMALTGNLQSAQAENARPTFEQLQRMPRAYQKKRAIRKVPPARTEKPPPKRAETPPPPPEPEVEKLPDARIVMVVGDFLASELAAGLTDAYAKAPGVQVVDKANGSSGFVRDDFYDWVASIGPLLDAVKPSVVVMMIGSNDRQPIIVDGKSEPVRSDGWVKEYTRRVQAFATIIEDRHIPLIWVGVPAFRSTSMTSDMLAFNDIYQNAVGAEKGTFVDIWDGFVDNNGAFTLTGPDVNGQPTRLRLDDGINFSRAGKAKIAFYVEKDLNHLLGDAALPGIDALPSANGPATIPTGKGPPQRTAPIALRDQGMDDGKTLAGATVTPMLGAETTMERLAVEGIASAPPIGRADNFGSSLMMKLPAKPHMPPPSDDDAIARIIRESRQP